MRHDRVGVSDLLRLQEALEKIAADLDQLEGRDHGSLRRAARRLHVPAGRNVPAGRTLETYISNFASVVKTSEIN